MNNAFVQIAYLAASAFFIRSPQNDNTPFKSILKL